MATFGAAEILLKPNKMKKKRHTRGTTLKQEDSVGTTIWFTLQYNVLDK
jgi:hypothetical protein